MSATHPDPNTRGLSEVAFPVAHVHAKQPRAHSVPRARAPPLGTVAASRELLDAPASRLVIQDQDVWFTVEILKSNNVYCPVEDDVECGCRVFLCVHSSTEHGDS